MGTTLDAASHVLKSPSTAKSERWNKLRPLKFGLLFGTILLALFSVNAWGYLDPLSLFNRALTVVIYPLTTLFVDATLTGLGTIPILSTPAYAVYDWFKSVIMPESQAFSQQLFWIALLFGGILAMEKVSRRFWCRYLCPAGALLGFLSQFRIFERIVNTSCNECGKCVRECKMDAIPSAHIPETSKVECIECFNCATNCPPKLNAIQYRFRLKPYHTKVDYSRRHFLETTFSSFMALGLLSLGLPNKTASGKTLRPPGSLPEPEFQDNCIRCLECIRICRSNGACLQPDGIHTSLLELWAPVAVMRTGYCEYNCNLCGQVCPTDAILPLSLEQKQATPMGLAYFDENLCIPFAKYEDCIVCEEHCPTPEKAIKLDEKDAIRPDGTVKRVKYPYVVRERCIGCGICETKCPLPGPPGIFVTIENQVRLTKADVGQA